LDVNELEEKDVLHFKTLNNSETNIYIIALGSMNFLFFISLFSFDLILSAELIISGVSTIFIFLIGILILITFLIIFNYLSEKEVLKEGHDIEIKKGKLIFESKLKDNSIYTKFTIGFIIVFLIIMFIISCYLFLININSTKPDLIIIHFFWLFFWANTTCLMIVVYPIIRYKYIWLYENGIGLNETNYKEKVYFNDDIKELKLKKKDLSITLEIVPMDKDKVKLDLEGDEVNELCNILQKNFSGLVEIM
jgi:hypothetical protein